MIPYRIDPMSTSKKNSAGKTSLTDTAKASKPKIKPLLVFYHKPIGSGMLVACGIARLAVELSQIYFPAYYR